MFFVQNTLLGKECLPDRSRSEKLQIHPEPEGSLCFSAYRIGGPLRKTPLRIFEHLQIKLAMNNISTGTMGRLGGVQSNYMIHLAIANKKLIDRACRIISELCMISYDEACYELFRSCSMMQTHNISPVAEPLKRLHHGIGRSARLGHADS